MMNLQLESISFHNMSFKTTFFFCKTISPERTSHSKINRLSKSDMLLKAEDPAKIKFGSILSEYNLEPDLNI